MDRSRDRLRQPLTQRIDPAARREFLIRRALAHITGRSDSAFQRMPFEIETAGIQHTPWPLESELQLPSAARVQVRRIAVPAQTHGSADQRARVALASLDLEIESPQALVSLGQS